MAAVRVAELEERLAEFLRRAMGEKRAAGEWDCAMTLANWVREVTGVDPAFSLRGSYSDAEWPEIVEREGGLVALVGRLADGAGLSPTDAPGIGDIGVVETRIGPAGAIRTRRGWALKLDDGIVSARTLTVLAAWRLPCPA